LLDEMMGGAGGEGQAQGRWRGAHTLAHIGGAGRRLVKTRTLVFPPCFQQPDP